MTDGIKRVAVLGAGIIGASWAANFLAQGLDVVASDPRPDGERFARDFVAGAWPTLERLGLAPGADPGRMRFVADPVAAMEGAQFVQESGPEDLAVKTELFARIDAVLPPEVILSSSSSFLMPSAFQTGCRHPERVLLGHPFNPPHLIPLVEVVGGALTSAELVDRAVDFYAAIGKQPIRLNKEIPGHVANRLQSAIWREAAHLVAEGVVDVAGVDAAIAHGPGLRWAIMGPVMTYHLAGGAGGLRQLFDHIGVAHAWPQLGVPELTPALEQKMIDGVLAEAAGRTIAELAADRDRKLEAICLAVRPL